MLGDRRIITARYYNANYYATATVIQQMTFSLNSQNKRGRDDARTNTWRN